MSKSTTLTSKPKAGDAALAQKVNDAVKPPAPAALPSAVPPVEPIVDAEIENLIPPPSGEELAALEAQMLADGGCRDPLVVWAGQNILLDGHNRLAICKKHGLKYTIAEMEFLSRAAVLNWVVGNQIARRNLDDEVKSYLRGRRYRAETRQGERNDLTSGHDAQRTTSERLAAEFKVDERTIRRDGDFAHDLDVLAENCGDEVRRKVLSRELKVRRARLHKLAGMLPSEQRTLVPELLAGNKPQKKPRASAKPGEALANAWAKVKEEKKQEAVKRLLADPGFAATLAEIQQAEPADQEVPASDEDE